MEDSYFQDNLPVAQRQEVEFELGVLNQTAPQINDLENQLLTARLNYQETLTENANKLKALSNRLGKCVSRTRPYFELCETQLARLADIQKATERYTGANASLSAAREALAKLEAEIGGCKDTTTLENMNQAIAKVNTAKQEVNESYRVHEQLLGVYNGSEQTLRRMERRYKSDINKAKPYFETKQQFDRDLQEAKLLIDMCAEKVALYKSIYADALSRLEQISASVHDTRRRQQQDDVESPSPPSSVRGEGVGAESVESIEEITCPHSDVFSPTPRLMEKSTFETDRPVYRVPSPKHCPGTSNCMPINSSSSLPLVNGLFQQMRDAAIQLDVRRHGNNSNSPCAVSSLQTNTPDVRSSPPVEPFTLPCSSSNFMLGSAVSTQISSSVTHGNILHHADFLYPSTLSSFSVVPIKRVYSLSNIANCSLSRS